MRSSVVYYILVLLESQDSVRIPGLGTLRRRVDHARLDLDSRKVGPPFARIDFVFSDKTSDHLLADFITHSTGVVHKEAVAAIEGFVNELLTAVNESGETTVENLGKFYSKNQRIFYTPDVTIQNLAYSGLRSIALPAKLVVAPKPELPKVAPVVPITRIEEKVTEVAEQQPPVTEETEAKIIPRERWRVPMAIPAMILLFILVTVVAVTNFLSESSRQYPASAYNRAPESEPSITPISDDTAYDITRDTQGRHELEPVDEQELTTLEDSVVQKLDQEGVVEAETPEKPIVANPIIEEVPVRVEPEVSTLDAAGQEWPGLGDSKCYVIVGAFGVSSNVDRMIDRLEGMGYGVATMPNRGLTQVGVTSTCDSLQIDKVLEDMRANVEAQAWIYKR